MAGHQAAAPYSARVDENIHYFESTCLVGNYPPTLWNIHDSEVWTNNHVKVWHNKLKKVLCKAHLNVFELVEVFQRKQTVMEVTIS